MIAVCAPPTLSFTLCNFTGYASRLLCSVSSVARNILGDSAFGYYCSRWLSDILGLYVEVYVAPSDKSKYTFLPETQILQ